MITLLKKFKNLTNDLSTVTRLDKNVVFIKTITAEVKLTGSDIEQIFKPLDFNLDYKYTNLLKGTRQLVECAKDEVFNNVSSSQIICENLELPQIKIGTDPNNHASIVNHAYIFNGCLWTTDARYLLKTDLHINSDIKAGIPARIYNLFKKIVWIGKKDNIIQICGNIDTKHQVVIQYKELEYLDKNINMLKSVSSPLDICDDGVIYDLTEVTNLKLSTKKMKHLIRFDNGLLSVHDNTFNYNIADFNHEDFNQFGKFTIDGSYLNMFKRIFNKGSIFKVNRLRTRANNITLKQGNNSMILMCVYE